MPTICDFSMGEKVWWAWSTTRGYGYSRRVPAVVIGFGSKRVRIRTKRFRQWWDREKGGYVSEWITEEKSVQPDKLTQRNESCEVVDNGTK